MRQTRYPITQRADGSLDPHTSETIWTNTNSTQKWPWLRLKHLTVLLSGDGEWLSTNVSLWWNQDVAEDTWRMVMTLLWCKGGFGWLDKNVKLLDQSNQLLQRVPVQVLQAVHFWSWEKINKSNCFQISQSVNKCPFISLMLGLLPSHSGKLSYVTNSWHFTEKTRK